MLKGVNRRIIEVLNPEDTYFERIILFLNPDVSPEEPSIGTHTNQYLKELSGSLSGNLHPKKSRSKLTKLLSFSKLLLSALLGGGIVFLFYH